jgi:hypothetical protein
MSQVRRFGRKNYDDLGGPGVSDGKNLSTLFCTDDSMKLKIHLDPFGPGMKALSEAF